MAAPDPIRAVALLGDDHTELRAIAVETIDDRIAVALSRGKHPKGYPSLDPNEDAVAAATDGSTTLLAVADAHFGFDSARAAIEAVQASAADLLRADPSVAVRHALDVSRTAIADALTSADPEHQGSRTTLAVAVLAGTRLTAGGFGDSQVAIVVPGHTRALLKPAPFLGPESDLHDARFVETSVVPGSQPVVATDGLFDFLGRDWAPKLEQIARDANPPDFATKAIEAAFAGGAGDNIALAVTRIEG